MQRIAQLMVEDFSIEFESKIYGPPSFDSGFSWADSFDCSPRRAIIIGEGISCGADV